MLILGIDPGAVTGWALIETEPLGVVERGDADGTLLDLTERLEWIDEEHDDDPIYAVAVEKPFRAMGESTMEAVKKLGVVELWAEKAILPYHSYHVSTIRRVVAGTGKAKDADVAREVRRIFQIPKNPGPGKGLGQHQPAALAAALTCAVEEYGVRL